MYADRKNKKKEKKQNIGKKTEHVKSSKTQATTSSNSKTKNTSTKKNKRCPYSNKCGGCQYVEMPYKKQF